jgi:HEAT repeat protein
MATPSRPGASAAARRSSPASARHAAASAKPVGKPTRPAPPANDEDYTPKATPQQSPSARVARVAPSTSSSRPAAPSRAVGKSGGMGLGFYVVVALAVVVLVGAFTLGPIRRGLALSALDGFKSDSANPAAITAADTFLDLAGDRPSHVTSAIYADRGPVEAQVHMAKKLKLFSSLVQIADRPLAGEATGRPTVTVAQRVLALQAGVAIYDIDHNGTDLLPDHIKDWARDSASPQELSLASMALLVKAKAKDTSDVLHQVANAKDADPVRVGAAIDGLAELADVSNLGFLIGLLTGPASDLALTRPALSKRIILLATPDHLPRLMELLDHPKDQVRAVAIESLGGPGMRMGDNAADLKKRDDLGKAIASKLTPTTPPVELAAAIKAVRGLRLFGARDAILELSKDIDARALEGIDKAFMAELLGKSLISSLPEPEPSKDGKPSAEDEIARQLHRQGDESIVKLIAGLDDTALRPVAAKALGLIRDKSYLPLRDAVDKLAAHGEDDGCMDALVTIVTKTYARDDVAKQCGRDKAKWQKFLEADRPRFEHIKEIVDWMAANGQYQYIKDGKERLTKSRDYIAPASEFVDGLLNEPKFLPPLGLTKTRIEGLRQDLKMLGMNVRKAWSGALE